ncbi:uncharacterized protein LOC124152011 [Haliotis rufescens]|uniref:uncharacterized protein LOC124152011 n=1 Tax=Haliotis rufescens TaxID=6454 RepID=UPI00201E74FF|nr:uncharacterized protein LOC124152011 [Haliotis rufescens]
MNDTRWRMNSTHCPCYITADFDGILAKMTLMTGSKATGLLLPMVNTGQKGKTHVTKNSSVISTGVRRHFPWKIKEFELPRNGRRTSVVNQPPTHNSEVTSKARRATFTFGPEQHRTPNLYTRCLDFKTWRYQC